MFSFFHDNKLNPFAKNLSHLVVLRFIGLLIQVLIISIAIQWFQIPLKLAPIIIILVVILIWNLYSLWRSSQISLISNFEFFMQLVFDVLSISAILYFAGGATNPFSWFFLLPVMIAATILPTKYVWSVAGLTIISYSVLLFYYIPLTNQDMTHGSFVQHIWGMWFGFILSSVLVAYFITGMAKTLRQRERDLSETREQKLRDEQVIAMGTLAAGAAHDLGTPLATIAILSHELQREHPADSNVDLHLKLSIIASQVMRCKEAISILSTSSGEIRAESGKLVSIRDYLHELTNNWKRKRSNIKCIFKVNGERSQQIISEKMLDQSLCNILDNAADVSPDCVEMIARWDDGFLEIEVNDRGPGLNAQANETAGKKIYSNKQHGLGVGLLLAYSVIERLQGKISFSNRPQGGLSIKIILPIIENHQ
jgi:two-component system sensor histidine kinase RegB